MSSPAAEPRPSGGKRSAVPLGSLDSLSVLVGAHPDALREMFGRAAAADPAELGDAPQGRLLALIPGADLFLLTRPILRALAGGGGGGEGASRFPWRGKSFDHGGNSGQNLVLGQRLFRFRAEVAPSLLDGRPALVLDYGAHGNPWPVRSFVDELRKVGEGIALGQAIFRGAGGPRPLFWFGLTISR